MKILFIGGCLLTTKTVEKEKRFINVLLSENPQLEISLARYSSFPLIEEIFSSHIAAEAPDTVVFLIRTFPFYILTKLLPRVPQIGGGTTMKIHPGIFSQKKKEWFLENDRLIVELDWNPDGTKRSPAHGINLFLGKFFMLDDWAVLYVKRKIASLNESCRQKNIRFFIAGPPAVLNDRDEHLLMVKLNSELIRFCEEIKIDYINLFSEDFTTTMLGSDKVHYNEAGHFQLAKKIEEKLFMHSASAAKQ